VSAASCPNSSCRYVAAECLASFNCGARSGCTNCVVPVTSASFNNNNTPLSVCYFDTASVCSSYLRAGRTALATTAAVCQQNKCVDAALQNQGCAACVSAGCLYNTLFKRCESACSTTTSLLASNPASSCVSSPATCGPSVEDYTAHHNKLRYLHGAPSLAFDTALQNEAVAYAQKLLNEKSIRGAGRELVHVVDECTKLKSSAACDTLKAEGCVWNAVQQTCGVVHGENLSWINQPGGTIGDALDAFYSEVANIDWSNPQVAKAGASNGPGGSQIGHFTQLIWKASTKVGCAKASDSSNTFVVCKYNPQGNVLGQFNTNVLNCDNSVAYTCARGKCIPKAQRCNGVPRECSMPSLYCNLWFNNPVASNPLQSSCIADFDDEAVKAPATTCV